MKTKILTTEVKVKTNMVRIIDPSTGLADCKVCRSRKYIDTTPNGQRLPRGTWQCANGCDSHDWEQKCKEYWQINPSVGGMNLYCENQTKQNEIQWRKKWNEEVITDEFPLKTSYVVWIQ